ncbi:MAG: MFS transporter [Thermoprotei archaeon]|nr:MAG: MFS transporter [Thermoprotei archaeon]
MRESEHGDGLGFRNVVALGLVSFFTDMSTEMILGLYPQFVVEVLGASRVVLGVSEGLAEMLSYAFRLVSGVISDRVGRRKPLVLAGYALSNLAKPFLSAARTWVDAVAVRLVDRLGKGVRTAPRDALLSESVESARAGVAFGVHRTLDQMGAVVGPLTAFLLLPLIGIRGVFLLSLAPGLAAVLVLAALVREGRERAPSKKYPLNFKVLAQRDFAALLAAFTLFSAGAFNFSFLLLRLGLMGVAGPLILLFYVLMNVAHTAVGIPAGYMADRVGKEVAVAAGYGLFAAACVACLRGSGLAGAVVASALYGAYMGFIETTQRAAIPDYVPSKLRASGYGVYYLLVGLSSLVANSVVGALWDAYGYAAAFTYSLGVSCAATVAMLALAARRAVAGRALTATEGSPR